MVVVLVAWWWEEWRCGRGRSGGGAVVMAAVVLVLVVGAVVVVAVAIFRLFGKIFVMHTICYTAKPAPTPSAPPSPAPAVLLLFSPCVPYNTRRTVHRAPNKRHMVNRPFTVPGSPCITLRV